MKLTHRQKLELVIEMLEEQIEIFERKYSTERSTEVRLSLMAQLRELRGVLSLFNRRLRECVS